jgi:outer membrane receptor protein involved in Fe transport
MSHSPYALKQTLKEVHMKTASKSTKTCLRNSMLALLGSTMLTTAPLYAQDAPADESDEDIIIVTAQKREQSLQDVPISIQALGASRLENALRRSHLVLARPRYSFAA